MVFPATASGEAGADVLLLNGVGRDSSRPNFAPQRPSPTVKSERRSGLPWEALQRPHFSLPGLLRLPRQLTGVRKRE